MQRTNTLRVTRPEYAQQGEITRLGTPFRLPERPIGRRRRDLEDISLQSSPSMWLVNVPMTSKKALGSIPFAEEKSVPVFFNDCIAARMPCTAATQETKEKTVPSAISCVPVPVFGEHTDNLGSHGFGFLASKGRRETARYDVDEDLKTFSARDHQVNHTNSSRA